jgi:phosphoesterase RecJ-like protein
MIMTASNIDAIKEAIHAARSILLVTHVGPDGDALGSLTAMGQALSNVNKHVVMMCDDYIANRFGFIPAIEKVVTFPDETAEFDLVIALDCGDEFRMGKRFETLLHRIPQSINIDHHITNTNFADINFVDGRATSTAEMLFGLFEALSFDITSGIATSLLTGVVTDTLGFRTVGVTPYTMKVAGALMDAGGDLATITMKMLNLKPMSTIRLWQIGLNEMKLDDGVLWVAISKEKLREIGHVGDSSHGLVNLLADVEDVAMSAVLLEMDDGSVRVGFRCRPPFSVAELAASLGGGGHALAAGCTVKGPLETAVSLVITKSKEAVQAQKAALAQSFD